MWDPGGAWAGDTSGTMATWWGFDGRLATCSGRLNGGFDGLFDGLFDGRLNVLVGVRWAVEFLGHRRGCHNRQQRELGLAGHQPSSNWWHSAGEDQTGQRSLQATRKAIWDWNKRAALSARTHMQAYGVQPWIIMIQMHQWGWSGHVATRSSQYLAKATATWQRKAKGRPGRSKPSWI